MAFLTEGKKVPMNVPTKQIRDIRSKGVIGFGQELHMESMPKWAETSGSLIPSLKIHCTI